MSVEPPDAQGAAGPLLGESVGNFLDALASSAPTPGGGSAAALSCAMGAALVAMVATLSERDGGLTAAEAREHGERLHLHLATLVDTDAEAFDQVVAAYRLPRTTEEEKAHRREEVQRALIGAVEVPLEVASAAVEVLRAAANLLPVANPSVVSDLGVAAWLCGAGLEGALLNVAINVRSIRDQAAVGRLRAEAARLRLAADPLRTRVVQAAAERVGA